MRPLLVAIHGILTSQTRADWPDRFDAWCEREGVNAHVLKKEYSAGPLPTWNVLVKNRRLAQGLAAEIELFYDNRLSQMKFSADEPKIHFVAHSNGTDVALKTVKLLAARGIPTSTIVLVGSVVEPDIIKNGIYDLMHEGDLDAAVAYASAKDSALGLESKLPWCAYKDLGRRGWMVNGEEIPAVRANTDVRTAYRVGESRIITRRFDEFDHGTYFDDTHREQTFALFRKDCGL